jgi:acetyl esterase/lipase
MRIFFIIFIFLPISFFAQDSTVIPLWVNGAPGFEIKKNEKEEAKDWWVKNIHNPSLTVFLPPKEIATGAAVVICPGGGYRALVFNAEGRDPAKFFNGLGVTAFVLKYRLFREENSPYKEEHAKQDIFRAMRLVRSLAKEYNIDTARIGVMGFSAGGEEAGWVSYYYTDKNFVTPDEIDRLSARPAFQILIYPGPLAVPDSVASTSPPSFLLAANDDECCSEPIIKLLQMHRKAHVPVEVHLYQQGNHAFNMGSRSSLNSIKTWPLRMVDWLNESGWLNKK